MKCPKCNFDQSDGGTDCAKCGVVFAKYLAKQNQVSDTSAAVLPPGSPAASDDKSNGPEAGAWDLFIHTGSGSNMVYLTGRALLLLVIIVWGLKIMFSSIESNYAGNSFMHLVNLPFHEAGHVIFRILGRFMMTLGGSLTQCLVPVICLVTFLVKTRDPFAASISLWWFGENLIDLAPYINDARALRLILLGGVTGQDVDDYHDWEFILRRLGLLEYDHLLARMAHVTGALLMICAMIWGAGVLLTQYRNRHATGRASAGPDINQDA